jgi:hypothetical protein
MSWASISSNQCVSLNNLRDAIANNIFIAKTTVPAGTKQITKTEALAYVDIQTAPLAGKASNQLVVKNNLNAAVYTYNRYDLNLTTCSTSNPIPVWSYYNIPYGSYTINGLYIYQIIPATHSTFTYEITSYASYTCAPVTRYTYLTNNVNPTTCATSNPVQWWSYNNYANGFYYINGPGTLYSLEGSSHTNYSNQITSATTGTCSAQTKYTYKLYYVNDCNCNLTNETLVYDVQSYSTGYYYVYSLAIPSGRYYIVSFSHTTYTTQINIQYSLPTCSPNPCKIWYFNNSTDNLTETFTYMPCGQTSLSTFTLTAGSAQTSRCVAVGYTPPDGNQGDHPWTFDETCCS